MAAPGTVRCGEVRYGMARYGMVWYGEVRQAKVQRWCRVRLRAWSGLARLWLGIVRQGEVRFGMVRQAEENHMKDHYTNLKERRTDSGLRSKYGISLKERNKLLHEQDYQCPICGCQLSSQDNPCVDHCHTSGAIRGILCSRCNLGLGHFGDSVEVLKRAIIYLEDT